ncbi:sulfotransferase 1C2-like [Ciona intestinalis]
MSASTSEKLKPDYSYLKHPLFPEGYPLFPSCTQEVFDSAQAYEPDSSDIFVVTYPKCGTTWLLNILYLIEHEGNMIGSDDNLNYHYPFIELVGGDKVQEFKAPRVIKTHLDDRMIKHKEGVKYIFVARNPKDCVVSFFHHTLDFHNFYKYKGGKFEDYFKIFMQGRVDWGDYFVMVPRWYEKGLKEKNVHFMLYEDMKNDTKSEIEKLADFLGPKWSDSIKREGVLENVIKNSSFNSMKSNHLKYCITIAPKDLKFMRKGAAGDWRNTLSDEQSREIDEKMKKVGKEYPGFDKVWEKYPDLL